MLYIILMIGYSLITAQYRVQAGLQRASLFCLPVLHTTVLNSFHFSYSVGERPLPSRQPPTKQKFSLEENTRGGGLVLDCKYILEVSPDADIGNIVKVVKEFDGASISSIDDGQEKKQEEKQQGKHELTAGASTETQGSQKAQKPCTKQPQKRGTGLGQKTMSIVIPGQKRRRPATDVIFDWHEYL